MHRTIDAGPGLLLLGGLLLLISLFLPWFDDQSAWTSFEALDLILAGLGIAALLAGAQRADDAGRVAMAASLAALLAVAVQLLDPPPVAGAHADREIGAWLAFGASLLMTAGAVLGSMSFTVRVDVRERERRRRVAAVDRRGAGTAAEAPGAPADEPATTAAAPERRAERGPGEPDPLDQRTQPMRPVRDDDAT